MWNEIGDVWVAIGKANIHLFNVHHTPKQVIISKPTLDYVVPIS